LTLREAIKGKHLAKLVKGAMRREEIGKERNLDLQMSTGVEYCLWPNKTSGALYHKVTTSTTNI
jgi:hypothetical protein